MNSKYLCCFDLETNGKEPATCQPVEIAAIIIDPVSLTIIPDSEFHIYCKPDPKTTEMGAVVFHADIKTKELGKKVTPEEILAEWETYQPVSEAWPHFVNYLRKWHNRQSNQNVFSAPIPMGHNIINFDVPITENMHKLYGDGKSLWANRDVIDFMHWCFLLFEGCPDIKSYSLDNMTEHFGLSKKGAHTAIEDTRKTAEIICRFLRFQREISKSKSWFKKAFIKSIA